MHFKWRGSAGLIIACHQSTIGTFPLLVRMHPSCWCAIIIAIISSILLLSNGRRVRWSTSATSRNAIQCTASQGDDSGTESFYRQSVINSADTARSEAMRPKSWVGTKRNLHYQCPIRQAFVEYAVHPIMQEQARKIQRRAGETKKYY